jgi:hypothetical protein
MHESSKFQQVTVLEHTAADDITCRQLNIKIKHPTAAAPTCVEAVADDEVFQVAHCAYRQRPLQQLIRQHL